MNRIILLILIIAEALSLLLVVSCEKEIRPPAVGKPVISKISVKGAIVESQIIWDGGSRITESGFCWNTTVNPTMEDFHIEVYETGGRFSCEFDTLKEGTRYYIRSYARNRERLSYGFVATFSTEAFKKPVVSSLYIRGVTHNAINCGSGEIYDNTGNIISKGIYWSTSFDPVIDGQKIDLGGGPGPIGCTIEGLQPGTVYYLRSYATNIVGTSYGGTKSGKTLDGCMTDIEGHIYYTVHLGNQEWMLRNLETSTFSNGDRIGTTRINTQNIEQEDNPVYQWAFMDDERYAEHLYDHGRLYTWYTVTDSRKICPEGWHLPTNDEWNELITYLGDNAVTLRFKYIFLVQLVGYREYTGQFQYGSNYGTYWWSATAGSSGNGYAAYCRPSDIERLSLTERDKKIGFSVRCVKD